MRTLVTSFAVVATVTLALNLAAAEELIGNLILRGRGWVARG